MSEYTPKQWKINNMFTAKKIKELEEGGGGGTVTVDSALSDTSENPVQNKIITSALNAIKVPMVVTLTPTETTGSYTGDVNTSAIVEAFNGKTPVYVYEANSKYMLQVTYAASNYISAALTTSGDIVGGLHDITSVIYSVDSSQVWTKTLLHYVADEGKPLTLAISELSATQYKITNATAAVIRAAWGDNRDVVFRVNGCKFELVNYSYTSGANYRFEFQSSSVDASTGELTIYTAIFVNSLTGPLYTHTYEATPDVS